MQGQLDEMRSGAKHTEHQLSIMEGQLTSMQIDERPWLSLDVDIGGPLAYGVVGTGTDVSWHIPLTYRLRNLGKTPAIDVVFFAHILPMVSGKEGIVFAKELDKACDFPEKMIGIGFAWGEVIFPQEEWPEKSFLVSGDEKIFEKAKLADPDKNTTRYFGQFLVAPCVTYKSTFSTAGLPFRTAKEYFITRRNGAAINLDGETINRTDLNFTPNKHGAMAR